jgi:hypothetical protein
MDKARKLAQEQQRAAYSDAVARENLKAAKQSAKAAEQSAKSVRWQVWAAWAAAGGAIGLLIIAVVR